MATEVTPGELLCLELSRRGVSKDWYLLSAREQIAMNEAYESLRDSWTEETTDSFEERQSEGLGIVLKECANVEFGELHITFAGEPIDVASGKFEWFDYSPTGDRVAPKIEIKAFPNAISKSICDEMRKAGITVEVVAVPTKPRC